MVAVNDMGSNTHTTIAVSHEQVARHNTRSSCYVTIEGSVYDVTRFLDDHPGGPDLVLSYAGKDVSKIMKDDASHAHSESAYEIMQDYLIASSVIHKQPTKTVYATGMSSESDLSIPTDVAADFAQHKFIDLNKPMLPQLWKLNPSKAFYMEQIHKPRVYPGGSAPLFPYAALEVFSKTPVWVIPLVWIPAVAYVAFLSAQGLPVSTMTAVWVGGLLFWTLLEYVLHRVVFHIDAALPDQRIFILIHFFVHGIHHYLPSDKMRLVMPPALFVCLATPLIKLAFLIFPYYYALAVISGTVSGYICYDCTHYLLHHQRLPAFWRSVKSYHLAHHYKNFELGYGVTSRFWDHVFGTVLDIGPKN